MVERILVERVWARLLVERVLELCFLVERIVVDASWSSSTGAQASWANNADSEAAEPRRASHWNTTNTVLVGRCSS